MKCLDLFCCGGGAGMGYHLAGMEVVGVDIDPQPKYPFAFVQADALEYLAAHGHEFDFIHASPPCQKWSIITKCGGNIDHPDLIDPVRELLQRSGKPWVIENVPGSPLRDPIMLCGTMFGLGTSRGYILRRHRYFEIPALGHVLTPTCQHTGYSISVAGHGTPSGNRATLRRNVSVAE